MTDKVKVIEQDNLQIVCNDTFIVVYNQDTKQVSISSSGPLDLKCQQGLKVSVEGSMEIRCTENFNVVAGEQLALDSLRPEDEPSIFLQCGKALA